MKFTSRRAALPPTWSVSLGYCRCGSAAVGVALLLAASGMAVWRRCSIKPQTEPSTASSTISTYTTRFWRKIISFAFTGIEVKYSLRANGEKPMLVAPE
jgi:hypothetical protein